MRRRGEERGDEGRGGRDHRIEYTVLMEGSKRPRCSRRGEKRRGGEERSYDSREKPDAHRWLLGRS